MGNKVHAAQTGRTVTTVVGVGLRSRREALGLPQAVLARLLGVSQNVVSSWEQATRTPRRLVLALSGRACLPSCIGLLRRARQSSWARSLGAAWRLSQGERTRKRPPSPFGEGGAFVVAGWLGVV